MTYIHGAFWFFPVLFLQCHIWQMLHRGAAHTTFPVLMPSQTVQVLIHQGWLCVVLQLFLRAETAT